MAFASNIDSDSASVLLSVLIGLAGLLLIWVLFEVLRTLIPRLYYYRWFLSQYEDIVDYDGKRVFCHPLPGRGILGWLLPTVAVDLDSMAQTHGLDAVMFLRFLRTSAYMFGVLSIGTAALLMPIYATGQNKNLPPDHPQFVTGINILSIANLTAKDGRLWGTLVAEFVTAIIIYIFTYYDYKKFVWLRRRYKARRIPCNFSSVVTEVPSDSLNEASIRDFFETIIPGSVAEVHHVLDATSTLRKIRGYVREVSQYEIALWRDANSETPGEPQLAKVKNSRTGKKEKLNPIVHHKQRAQEIEREVLQEQEERDPQVMPQTTSAIVLFKDIATASILSQSTIWKTTSSWKVHPGWDPGAINWSKLAASDRGRKPITIIGNVLIIFITIFWGLVIVSIQALENFSTLAKVPGFEFLQRFAVTGNRVLLTLVQGVLPSLLLMLLLKLIPLIFRQILNRQKIYALPLIETRIRNFFYVFLIFSNFVYVVISGTILQELDVIIRNPTLIVQQLAVGIPKQGVFMMKYVLLNALVGYPLYVLDPGRLIVRYFMLLFGGKTERQNRNADRIFSQFFYFKFYALSMMISLLGSVYTTIAPLINAFTALYFFIGYLSCKFKLLYTCYYPAGPVGYWQYGGIMHEGCFSGMLVAMLIHQVSMVVLFGIYQAVAQAVIEVLLLAGTVYFIIAVQRKFSTLAATGSLAEIIQSKQPRKVPEYYYGMYVHPGLTRPNPGPTLYSHMEEYKIEYATRSRFGRKEAQFLTKTGADNLVSYDSYITDEKIK
mmetsp:Transcript_534/g.1825  ORF Transcript_534/g.1825 Transcript_534/m.1825 type:complete len:775 (-) Transcript_534:177-2501(-)|eukprot:CAMPEP_0198730412 /NCGR_PEP_ID=MMETSP1475-20131203/24463_1 /TAXON_ID= ORGANISM="Unidentified sp., Strain CCMP1999" /NCGR_SAMPLE_ID=MMETSP1475 /ASSEMBLY_ACC=CAM_ASM_001111 /LENGTH=774 /DNA_ID=CAMNT_0044493213 /DNA_START=198 /DNA_END=2522 /DNA_ORIENTATION=-